MSDTVNLLAFGTDVIGSADTGSGSGGHIIENTNGTDLPQEDNLQFVGVYTEDDSENDRTKVNVVREMTKAQMDALSAAEKVGFIRTSDEADNPYQQIDASDVSYGSATVEDALDDLTYQSLTVTPEANYAGYTCIVRVYKDRIVLYFNGQNSQTIVPTGVSIFGTISNWTYGVRQVQGVIRDASGANYIYALFGIDSNGIIYISAPASFPSGLYPNCMTISDTILL